MSLSGTTFSLLTTCGNGEVLQWNGASWLCALAGTTYTIGPGLSLNSNTLSLLTSCASGQVLQWSGTTWACATPTGGSTYSNGAGLTLTGNVFAADNGYFDARYLSKSGGVLTGNLAVGSALSVNIATGFVGVNRSSQVSSSEYFGVYAPVPSGSYGGMYVGTGIGGWPFYGYLSPTGSQFDFTAWTYLDGQTGDWKLSVGNSDRLTVNTGGHVGVGTTSPLRRLHVSAGNAVFASRVESSHADATVAEFSNTTSGAVWEYGVSGSSGAFGASVPPGSMYVYHQGTPYPAIVVGGGNNNNVGIGTGSPTEKLEVVGNLKVTGDIVGSAPWTAFPFSAGHQNSTFPGYQGCQYRKIGDLVYLRGILDRSDLGNIGSNELLGTLPVGFRPPANLLFPSGATSSVTILANGEVRAGWDGPTYMSLDGIFFSTTP